MSMEALRTSTLSVPWCLYVCHRCQWTTDLWIQFRMCFWKIKCSWKGAAPTLEEIIIELFPPIVQGYEHDIKYMYINREIDFLPKLNSINTGFVWHRSLRQNIRRAWLSVPLDWTQDFMISDTRSNYRRERRHLWTLHPGHRSMADLNRNFELLERSNVKLSSIIHIKFNRFIFC